MSNRSLLSTVFLTLSATVLLACQKADEQDAVAADPSPANENRIVYAVNYPLAWMAQFIGDDAVVVELPVPEGVDPAHWSPSPDVVLDYQGADLVLLNGAGYAEWIQFASLSPGKVVDTSRGLEGRFVAGGEVVHAHGAGGEHEHGNVASHTWLDPTLAMQQASSVAGALSTLLPSREAEFQQRLDALQTELRELDQGLESAFAGWQGVGVLYSHPVYQYLDARYELKGTALPWEPGEDPGAAEWERLGSILAEQPAAVMLWEGEPLPVTAERLRALGVEPVVFETGAVRPTEGDYMTLMNKNLERVVALEPQS